MPKLPSHVAHHVRLAGVKRSVGASRGDEDNGYEEPIKNFEGQKPPLLSVCDPYRVRREKSKYLHQSKNQ